MNEWRYRVNWRRKLILQRRVKVMRPLGPSVDWVFVWRDATVGDLGAYYRDWTGHQP